MATALQTTTTTASEDRLVPRFLSLAPPNARSLSLKLKPFAESALAEANRRLAPATRDDFRRELAACLTLVAPSGMSENDRGEWYKAAWGTLRDLPVDLLAIGCTAARRRCDHPSKIVPVIMEETTGLLNQRRRDHSEIIAAMGKMGDQPSPEPRCTPEEAARILDELGFKDGARVSKRTHLGKPIAPDREWYLEQGVEPRVLDETMAPPTPPAGGR